MAVEVALATRVQLRPVPIVSRPQRLIYRHGRRGRSSRVLGGRGGGYARQAVHPLVALLAQVALLLAGFAGLPWLLVLCLSVVLAVYFLAFSEADCRAVNRDKTLCRNNARGLLGACHLQQHKQQKAWRRLTHLGFKGWLSETARGALGTTRQVITTLGSIASVVSAVVAVLGYIATR